MRANPIRQGRHVGAMPLSSGKDRQLSTSMTAKGSITASAATQRATRFHFVRETENVGFMEAVQDSGRGSRDAGARTRPEAQKKADRRTQLAEVMEQAVQSLSHAAENRCGRGCARLSGAARALDEAHRNASRIGLPPKRQGVVASDRQRRRAGPDHRRRPRRRNRTTAARPTTASGAASSFRSAMRVGAASALAGARWIQMRGRNT